jgi:hypothetical protein
MDFLRHSIAHSTTSTRSLHSIYLPETMRASIIVLASAISAHATLVAAQDSTRSAASSDEPIVAQITAASTASIGDNSTAWLWTAQLKPGDEGYVSDEEAAKIEKRDGPVAFMCENTNWIGNCKWMPLLPYRCNDFKVPLISSFGVSEPAAKSRKSQSLLTFVSV